MGKSLSAQKLLQHLKGANLKLVVAESLTGGALASEIVAVPGASEVFVGGFVAYDSQLKVSMLGVDRELLDGQGPVCLEVASQMALGAQDRVAESLGCSRHDLLAISTTGVAGPTQQGQPVGTVFIAVALGERVVVFEHLFAGDRAQIRAQSVAEAIGHAVDLFI